MRVVTTTGEAGEKKENIIGECHACSSCTQKVVPQGTTGNGPTQMEDEMRRQWGRVRGVESEEAAEHLLGCSGDSERPPSLMENCFIRGHFCAQRKKTPFR